MGKEDLIIISSLSCVMIVLKLLTYALEKAIEKNTGRCCGDCDSFERCFHYVNNRNLYNDRNYNEHPACKNFKEKKWRGYGKY